MIYFQKAKLKRWQTIKTVEKPRNSDINTVTVVHSKTAFKLSKLVKQ